MRHPIFSSALVAIAVLCAANAASAADTALTAKPVEVKKIWSGSRYYAFTDLIYFKDRFLCTFREGEDHASPGGEIRVLASPDGGEWKSIAVLTSDEYDLRDPKFSVAPDGRLVMNGGATSYTKPEGDKKAEIIARHSFVSFSEDGGATWSKPKVFTTTEEDLWLWRVTWRGDTAYGIGKQDRKSIILMTSKDGVEYQRHQPPLLAEQFPNEAVIRFDGDGTAYCLVRREGVLNDQKKWGRASALLGASRAPYREWTWKDTDIYLGGPNLFQLPDGRWIIAARTRNGPAQMSLLELNMQTGKTNLLLNLPSGGDCSYAGMVWKDDLLWLSYYSSHEGKPQIYFAKVDVK